MTRKIICFEGVEKIPGQIFELDSLMWEEPIVVTWECNFDISNVLGFAQNLQREDDGSITADIHISNIELAEKLHVDENTSFGFWANQIVEVKRKDGPRRITSGLIKAICATENVPW